MWNENQKEALLNVCRKHAYKDTENVIVPEPYLPYMPKNWNGILVLAEAQTLITGYWRKLKVLDSMEKMTRLGLGQKDLQSEQGHIGIGPWDGGTIKLALQTIFERTKPTLKLEDVAVSNAVPWTKKANGRNVNPDKEMQAKAAKFWKDIFDAWKPDIKALVVLGNVAESVMKGASVLSNEKYENKCLKLRLPSTNAICRVCGMFDYKDLQIRFPEIQKTKEAMEEAVGIHFKPWQIFFACHAVSLGVPKFKEWFGGVK